MCAYLVDKFLSPALGTCACCGKERLVLQVAPNQHLCDACSYVIREEWNDIKMLRLPALDPKIATSYVVIPRLLPSRSELDVTGYKFISSKPAQVLNTRLSFKEGQTTVDVATNPTWPMTSYNPDRRELAKWLHDTVGIVTWPKGMTRIYAGFDPNFRFAEVVLLTLWGYRYEPETLEKSFGWCGFEDMISPESTKGAFVIGAKAGFEGFLMRRELAPAATLECGILGEAAIRYMAAKRGEEKRPVWSTGSMVDVYFQGMTSHEKVVVGQLLGMSDDEEMAVPATPQVVAQVVPVPQAASSAQPPTPRAARTSGSQQDTQQTALDFAGSTPLSPSEKEDCIDFEEDNEGGMAVVRGPLDPEDAET